MERKIIRSSRAGSVQSNDLLVTINPGNNGIEIEIKSVVSDMFYDSIKETVTDELKALGVKNCEIKIDDRGALPFAIRARVKTAVDRGGDNEL